jgi:hypothetical protein
MSTQWSPSKYWIERTSSSSLQPKFQALLEEVRVALEQVGKLPEARGRIPLSATLLEFARFSRDYFDAFPYEASDPASLNRQDKALGRVQREWLTLYPLVEQRCSERSRNLAAYLQMADAVATDCISRGFAPGTATGTRPRPADWPKVADQYCLTLFEKSHHISRFIYSRVPSVAIPLVDWDAPWLWLGLAHEVGHYHYWNRSGLKERLEQSLLRGLTDRLFDSAETAPDFIAGLHQLSAWKQWKDKLEIALLRGLSDQLVGNPEVEEQPKYVEGLERLALWAEWQEEIWADVFGALILGPAYIRSLITWLCPQLTIETVLDNDHDHPLPLLRPLIQIEAFRSLQKRQGVAGDLFGLEQMESEWKGYWTAMAPERDFDAWIATKSTGDIPAEACLQLIALVAEAMVEAVYDEQATYYSAETHEQVIQVGNTLAQASDPGQQPALSPALSLPAAWYAWEQIVSNARLSKEGRNSRLESTREWIRSKTVSATQVLTSAPADVEPGIVLQPIEQGAGPWEALGSSDSFRQLRQQLRVEGLDDEAIAERLLEQEFSTQEQAWGATVTGAFHAHTHGARSHTHYHPV